MIIFVLVVLGLCFGSFVNALVWRTHQQSMPKKKRTAADKELSIVSGRSMCTHCKHTLAWYDLLPLFSWLSLGGKCRYCQKSIGKQYPLVELATAALFVASYAFWPADLVTTYDWLLLSFWLASLVGLVALFVYDLRWMLLPNRIVFSLLSLASVSAAVQLLGSDNPVVLLGNFVGAVLVAGGIFYVLFQVSSGRWIGGGDVKLGFVLGLLLGSPGQAFLMLFLASVLGLIAGIPALILGKSNLSSKIPFGPFLITATVLVKLFGAGIITWYADNFLYL